MGRRGGVIKGGLEWGEEDGWLTALTVLKKKNRLITVTCIIHDFVENGVSFSGKLIWHRREISTVFA